MILRDGPSEIRKIPPVNDFHRLETDLKVLCAKAVAEGITKTAVIDASNVVFRQSLRNGIGNTPENRSIHWPVRYPKDSIEDAIHAFKKGIFFMAVSPNGMPDYRGGPITDPNHRITYRNIFEIVTIIESSSFYMGYHLAMGFGTGNCRSIFCHAEANCNALRRGRVCLYPYKGRPSMESVGIDARAIALALQWDGASGSEKPLLAGLVMIS